ncbi:UDP-N-acetylmuramoyl-L-alanine--D-glutamate ligase [Rickettsia endosymbiont of Cardiosporidium cionae]|uniref:UDP-N-acetylmuramoyl-L-alanine--D-glutamate ligase n=1 Tax=Rickettsia endosymbiont of Cardiosporidium cionae TaxID=2777155 RepID=UPI001895A026|nr:UDP-N-acetylmuramoyl-L-alanine--D-glutamate ligase [Rickettsia endosymbiont of Cardiosporidium cionae]KAF8818656.1 UDP-N-acetylmuramoyl-L-alanine--D-glutamate ligase [Rickettsia endosymbiont of Cardiosporidium cionae]
MKKNIGILGLGVTGTSLYKYFVSKGYNKILCYDDQAAKRKSFLSRFDDATIIDISDSCWKNLDVIYLSPGISSEHKIYDISTKYSIGISSDIDLFYSQNINSKFIAITGTNGKTTVTSLVFHIMKSAGIDCDVGGNIGQPVLNMRFGKAFYILELSSFQIDLLKIFKPTLSLIVNIFPDHLDRYKDFTSYIHSKFKLCMLSDINVIGIFNDITSKFYTEYTKSYPNKHIITFFHSSIYNYDSRMDSNSLYIKNSTIIDNISGKTYHLPDKINLLGDHNQSNILAGYIICRIFNIPATQILQYIRSFESLEHRLQYIGYKYKISFYNDSKATNSNATKSALLALEDILWILGGVCKETDFSALDVALLNVRKAYVFGKDRLILSRYLEGKLALELFDCLDEAFLKAVEDAGLLNRSCNILLSPVAASFDQFSNFMHRGNHFVDLVKQFLIK